MKIHIYLFIYGLFVFSQENIWVHGGTSFVYLFSLVFPAHEMACDTEQVLSKGPKVNELMNP